MQLLVISLVVCSEDLIWLVLVSVQLVCGTATVKDWALVHVDITRSHHLINFYNTLRDGSKGNSPHGLCFPKMLTVCAYLCSPKDGLGLFCNCVVTATVDAIPCVYNVV